MVKASQFMYAMIVIIGIFAIIGGFISNMAINYNVEIPATDNQTLTFLKNTTAMNVFVEEQKAKAMSDDEAPQTIVDVALDILGLWFERGVATVKLIPKVLVFFEDMITLSLQSISGILGVAYQPLRFMIIGLVTTAIMLGVIVSAIIRKDI